jgi:hypothetical protein
MPDAPIEHWFAKTPDECTYSLTMYDDGGGSIQEVKLTREDYLTLKNHLGSIRGFHYADQLAQLKQSHEDIQQGAFDIDVAREVLAKYPALVLAPEFPPELQELLKLDKGAA